MNRPDTIRLSALLLLGCGVATSAQAWEHTTQVWLPEDMPLFVRVADDGTNNTIENCLNSDGWEGCCEESVPTTYCLQATEEGFDAWNDAQCADFTVNVLDGIANPDDLIQNKAPTNTDRRNSVAFNDPGSEVGNDSIAEVGTLAVTSTSAIGAAFIFDGTTYTHTFDSDITFNENVEFISHELIDSCQGNGTFNFRSVMTHEIGHLLGMGHSCEDPAKGGEPCTDPTLRDATMNWTEGPCETKAVDINSDDIEGITALYGPSATFSCSHQVDEDQVVGVVPFDLNCVIVSDFLSEVTGASWNFGDGGTSEDMSASHTYTEAGNYTIQMTVTGERAACGEEGWENNFRKVGYVRACDVPDSKFLVEQVEGLQYQMLNESDVSVYGCISDIQWDVFAGASASGEPIMDPIKAWEPIIDFPEAGTYTVVMSLGGIGGTGGSVATFDVKRTGNGNATGCNTAGGAGGFGLLFAAGLLARRRRS